ncbi:MAG: dephospho-CoA kinase [Proteobacteria bacterium]|nr:dephospho-CoA kinase [Pseudomonadota bacterium]
MILIGITGVIGSGKTTVAGILKKLNIPVIDADEISRKVTKKDGPAYIEIIKHFGAEILNQDGEINRKKLANIVFNDINKKKLLESIIHPLVQIEREKMIKEICAENPNAIVALDIPLLFEAGLENTVDYIICTYADIDTIYERVKERDNVSKEEFLLRLSNQLPLEEKIKRSHFVIDTRKDLKEIESELKDIIKKIAPNFVIT